MAQRQESSVIVSIEELLREAHVREEQERRNAEASLRAAQERRLEELRQQQQAEEARVRAAATERALREFEEEKRRVELRALEEGAVVKARTEAEAQARLAEMTARQDHERSLHALRHDRHKKRLSRMVVALVAVTTVGGFGGGLAIKRSRDESAAADARLRSVRDEKDQLEQEQQRLQLAIANATDPAEVAELRTRLEAAERQVRSLPGPTPKANGGHVTTPAGPAVKRPVPPSSGTCIKGDPLCATIP